MQTSGTPSTSNVGSNHFIESDEPGGSKVSSPISSLQSGAEGLLEGLIDQPRRSKPKLLTNCVARFEKLKLKNKIPFFSGDIDSDLGPETVERRAVSKLKRRLIQEGESFRTTPAERADFVAAFKRYHAEVGEKTYVEYKTKIMEIQDAHPDLAHIPTDDLIALRGWTSGDYILVQNALDRSQADRVQDSFPYLKAIVSAYHSLPERFIYTGTAYTGETQTGEWVEERYHAGETTIDWRIFAASETEEAKWQHCNVNWETLSRRGKRISLFSERPEEKEVMFVPPTWQKNRSLHVKPGTETSKFPEIDIEQEEAAHKKRRGIVPAP
ncbi:MAG: hypothetical protein ABW032_02790 [Burkholderiaceae bacterium]